MGHARAVRERYRAGARHDSGIGEYKGKNPQARLFRRRYYLGDAREIAKGETYKALDAVAIRRIIMGLQRCNDGEDRRCCRAVQFAKRTKDLLQIEQIAKSKIHRLIHNSVENLCQLGRSHARTVSISRCVASPAASAWKWWLRAAGCAYSATLTMACRDAHTDLMRFARLR
jgi:hypothetical protein